jgi:hypothetical protein
LIGEEYDDESEDKMPQEDTMVSAYYTVRRILMKLQEHRKTENRQCRLPKNPKHLNMRVSMSAFHYGCKYHTQRPQIECTTSSPTSGRA